MGANSDLAKVKMVPGQHQSRTSPMTPTTDNATLTTSTKQRGTTWMDDTPTTSTKRRGTTGMDDAPTTSTK
jgi:hypothetical protein